MGSKLSDDNNADARRNADSGLWVFSTPGGPVQALSPTVYGIVSISLGNDPKTERDMVRSFDYGMGCYATTCIHGIGR